MQGRGPALMARRLESSTGGAEQLSQDRQIPLNPSASSQPPFIRGRMGGLHLPRLAREDPDDEQQSGPSDGEIPLDPQGADKVAGSGHCRFQTLAGLWQVPREPKFAETGWKGSHFGLVGMIDPLRPEPKRQWRHARARASRWQWSPVIIRQPHLPFQELGLADSADQVVTGMELKDAEAKGEEAVDSLTAKGRVYARVEPQQKVLITNSLVRNGKLVAVTGDGANDAPALHAAHVGVAMGKGGTDVAKESADLIITDDNFASIVSGIEEGRIVYNNLRKVIFFSISTGVAEIFLFILALIFNMPLPLLAVQLLWLNLVTNGIQDVALAFEPAEGGEMNRPPRPANEAIFNRLMVEKVALVAVVVGGLTYAIFHECPWAERETRNIAMIMMVLFENAVVFASRSELKSAFSSSPPEILCCVRHHSRHSDPGGCHHARSIRCAASVRLSVSVGGAGGSGPGGLCRQ